MSIPFRENFVKDIRAFFLVKTIHQGGEKKDNEKKAPPFHK
jgi:hypothetical protein